MRSASFSLPKLRLYLPLLTLLGAPAFSCAPGGTSTVVHPEPDKPNTVDFCKDQDKDERSCSHCVSKPGCGWVEGGGDGTLCVPGDRDGPADTSVLAGGGTWCGTLDSCPQPDPVSNFESGKIDAPKDSSDSSGGSESAPESSAPPSE